MMVYIEYALYVLAPLVVILILCDVASKEFYKKRNRERRNKIFGTQSRREEVNKELIKTLRSRAPTLESNEETPNWVVAEAIMELDKALHLRDAHTVILKLLECPLGEILNVQTNNLEPLPLRYLAQEIVKHRIKMGK